MSKKQRKLLSKIHKKRFAEGAKIWNEGKHTGQQTWNKGLRGVSVSWWKGKKLNKKHRQHLSESHKGSHKSEETKQKIRDKMLEYWRKRKLTKEGGSRSGMKQILATIATTMMNDRTYHQGE